MNFALLWLAALVVALLWVATDVACVARLKLRWVRALLSMIILLVPLAVLGMFVVATATAKFNFKIENNWFAYAASLFLTFLAGTAFILWQGERHEPGSPPNAAHWRRAPLAIAGVIAATVWYMTVLNMDLATRARCAILSVELNSVYLATLPAITTEDQNAAPLYEQAFARFTKGFEEERNVQNPPTGLHSDFDPTEPATIAFLDHQAGTIALLRRAAALPACRFDSDLLDPNVNALIPALNDERNAANVLWLDAREETARGHVASAINDVAAMYGMSRQFGERPLVVSALVGVGIDAVAKEAMEVVLPTVHHKNELDGFRLDQLPPLGHVFRQALRGEESFGVTLYGSMPTSQMKMAERSATQYQAMVLPSFGDGMDGALFRAFFLDLDGYIKLMAELQNSATQPYFMVRGQLPAPHRGTPTQAPQIFGSNFGGDLFLSIVGPALSRLREVTAQGEANDACTQTAVAMTRYRLDHGALPNHLDELVPVYLDAVPTDPFDGQPLRLVIKNNQWIIYSVGPDRVDDGGIEMNRGKGDVIFTLNFSTPNPTTQATSGGL